MNAKPYNTEQRTKRYLNLLEKWIKKIDKYKHHNYECHDKSLIDDEWLRKADTFPINRRGDVLLIITPKRFAYHAYDQRHSICSNELKGKICEVLGLFDNTTGYYHGPPEGDYDLEVKIRSKDYVRFLYIDPQCVAYAASSLPPYIFLPFPERLREFCRFLPFFTKKPEKLERILDNYYKSLR